MQRSLSLLKPDTWKSQGVLSGKLTINAADGASLMIDQGVAVSNCMIAGLNARVHSQLTSCGYRRRFFVNFPHHFAVRHHSLVGSISRL